MTTSIMTEQTTMPLVEAVLGVDTHRDVHVAAVTTDLGSVLAEAPFAATAQGYEQLLDWARAIGLVRRAGVEGTGSYGAALCRFLHQQGVAVTEVNRPDRAARRSRGKNDTVDAVAAAHAVISGRATALPKSGDGPVEEIRIYKIAKDSAVKARRQAINQLKAVLVNAHPSLRESLAGLGRARLIGRCADLEDGMFGASEAAVHTLRTLARRVQALDVELKDLLARITVLVQQTAPALLDEYGVGADSAAVLLRAAGDNPERFTDEAAFAALCGVSPVEQSSGRSQRRRLNRGGDRQANAALFRIVMTRLRDHQPTRDYLARRTTEGRTKREVIRCLKRYVARHLFKIIQSALNPDPATT